MPTGRSGNSLSAIRFPLVVALGLWGSYELVANDGARNRLMRPAAAEPPPPLS